MRVQYFSADTDFVYKELWEGARSVWIHLAILGLSLASQFAGKDNKIDIKMPQNKLAVYKIKSLGLSSGFHLFDQK